MTDLESTIRELVRDELRRITAPPPDVYLSTADAATLADVTADTIRRWVRSGKLPAGGTGRAIRIKQSALERLLREGKPQTGKETPEQRIQARYGR